MSQFFSLSPLDTDDGISKTTVDDDPWRYRCPECDSSGSRLRKRQKRVGMELNHEEYQDTSMPERRQATYDDVADWYCDACSTPIEEPLDKKKA